MIQALVTGGESDFLTMAIFLFTIVVLGAVAYVFGFKPIQNSDAADEEMSKTKEKPAKSKSKDSGKDKKKADKPAKQTEKEQPKVS